LVNPPLLGMKKVLSENAVRRGFDRIEEEAELSWQQERLGYCTGPLLSEPWILDTVRPLYGIRKGRCTLIRVGAVEIQAIVGARPHPLPPR
jgi:hypothetical protein